MSKSKILAACTVALLTSATMPAQAWWSKTHMNIVKDAVAYMAAHPSTTNYAQLQAGVERAGYTMDQFTQVLAQSASDVDNFSDTYICGAITGECELAPIWGTTSSLINYTVYWHFQNHTQGPDVHGNPYGGYNYAKLTVWGSVDDLAASWLYGDYLDDGPGGLSGWFGDGSRYNSYGITEAHYRMGGYSDVSMYNGFQQAPFQPISNLLNYWFQQFLTQPTVQTLGYALHCDQTQPHHVWTTSSLNHYGWESWVDSNYSLLDNSDLVTQALNDLTPLQPTDTDIRALVTQSADIAYAQGGLVLSSTDYNDRLKVGRIMIPHAIAYVVTVLNRAALRL